MTVIVHECGELFAVKMPNGICHKLRSEEHAWRSKVCPEGQIIIIGPDDFIPNAADGARSWTLNIVEDEHGLLGVDRSRARK